MAGPSLADLNLFYTGAGSNSTPSLSIGDDISSARIFSQSCSAPTTLTGVSIVDGMGNGVGAGTLTYTAASKTLTWQPYGGTVGTAVDVSTNGTYFIQGGNNGGGLAVTVTAASLPTSNVSNTITVANRTQQFFADTTKAESDAGVTKYHCFAIKNNHATDPIVGIKLYISENTPGQDTMALYLDPLAAGNGITASPTAVANENTAPGGSTFVSPDSAVHADALAVGTLNAGQVRFFWVRQTTPAGITTPTPNNTFKLGMYMKG